MLLVSFAEASEENFLPVGLAVAVGILGIEDVGRAGDEDSLAPRCHAGRKAETVEEHGRLVELAVLACVIGLPEQRFRNSVLLKSV